MKKIITGGLILLVVGLFSFYGYSQSEGNVNMTVNELREQMGKNKNLVILDVRTKPELISELGHIEGIIHIPVQELGQRVGELDQYKGKEIAVICRSGNRSRGATKLLIENGHNAKNVTGGMIDWRRNGF